MHLEQVNLDSVDRMVYSQKNNVEARNTCFHRGRWRGGSNSRLLISVDTGGILVTGRERMPGELLCWSTT